MDESGAKSRSLKYRLEHAVDMSTHLQEVIAEYTRRHAFLVDLLPWIAPAIKDEPDNCTKQPPIAVKDQSVPLFPSDKDNPALSSSLASSSSISVAAAPMSAVIVVKQENDKKSRIKFNCNYCDFKGKSKMHLHEHLYKKHRGSQFHQCNLCNYKGKFRCHLRNHMARVHPGQRDHGCPLCGEVVHAETIYHHMTIHSTMLDGQNYTCLIKDCRYRGRLPTYLAHLSKKHSNIRLLRKHQFKNISGCDSIQGQVTCSSCDFSCKYKETLEVHMKKKHLKAWNVKSEVEDSGVALYSGMIKVKSE
ncbi:RE1-silencing transcription factor B-like [Watersipora subatra]|uniref:RE1-silencing transcription factor B-like n=1 Tax=Watersipora subatra TaxID=2589382 RepID=UPI00355C07B8